jgi:hypothetical protein
LNNIKFILVVFLLFNLTGCADITLPTPKEIIEKPIGQGSVKVGMTKSQVKEIWGGPDQINYIEDDKRWGGAREEWVYFPMSSKTLPVGYGYFSETRKLYFDGENLTNIEDSSK